MAKSSLSAFTRKASGDLSGPLAGEDSARPHQATPLGGLWQIPLLLVSLGLFTLAAWLFIDPQPAPSFQRQLAIAQRDIEAERYDAALGRLNDLLSSGIEGREEAQTRLLAAEALDLQMRRSRRQESPQAYRRIVSEIQRGYALGAAATADTSDRLARSFEALGEIDDAAANYRRAVELLEQEGKAEKAVPMRRSAIDMLVAHDRQVSATDALREFLDVPNLSDDERAWALGELARMSIDAGEPAEARSLLAAALALSPDESIQGQANYRFGYAAWKLGDHAEAEKRLKLAREQLGPGHFLDAEACYLLGRLAQEREAPAEADAYYQIVLRDHPGSRTAPKAQLARGVVKLLLGEDEQGVADLGSLADEMVLKPALAPLKADLLESLGRATRILAGRARYQLALDLMAREQAIEPDPPAEFFARLGLYFERHSDQVEATIADAEPAQRPMLENRVRGLRRRAGDAYVAYSRHLTLKDDEGYGKALWKGVELYEKASDLKEMIAALELFCDERPDDPIIPDALHRLGQAYQASGRQDKATQVFVRLRDEHPHTLAAAEAAVPLAQAYIALGDARYPQAEGILRSVVEDNPTLGPESQAFRQAVWELGHLYYRMGRYGEALARLEEFGSRYADYLEDENPRRAPQLAFLKADCYRKAAAQRMLDLTQIGDPLEPVEADAQLAASGDRVTAADDEEARRFLQSAHQLFEQTISLYRTATPSTPLDETYERLAYFYRADCLFDLGRFDESIKLYDTAASRYRDDPAILAAYVQIGNAYIALGRPEEARVANERAMWLLKRVPPEAFTEGRFSLPRDYWEQWLQWAGETGVW